MIGTLHRLSFAAAAVAALCLMAGCGAGERDEELGSLSGKVTFNGGPLPAGSVLVLESTQVGASRTAQIQEDGTYNLSGGAALPVGTYKVAVTPQPDPGVEAGSADYDAMMSGEAEQPTNPNAQGFPVPEKYRSTATSDKTVEVKPGQQELNIDITG